MAEKIVRKGMLGIDIIRDADDGNFHLIECNGYRSGVKGLKELLPEDVHNNSNIFRKYAGIMLRNGYYADRAAYALHSLLPEVMDKAMSGCYRAEEILREIDKLAKVSLSLNSLQYSSSFKQIKEELGYIDKSDNAAFGMRAAHKLNQILISTEAYVKNRWNITYVGKLAEYINPEWLDRMIMDKSSRLYQDPKLRPPHMLRQYSAEELASLPKTQADDLIIIKPIHGSLGKGITIETVNRIQQRLLNGELNAEEFVFQKFIKAAGADRAGGTRYEKHPASIRALVDFSIVFHGCFHATSGGFVVKRANCSFDNFYAYQRVSPFSPNDIGLNVSFKDVYVVNKSTGAIPFKISEREFDIAVRLTKETLEKIIQIVANENGLIYDPSSPVHFEEKVPRDSLSEDIKITTVEI